MQILGQHRQRRPLQDRTNPALPSSLQILGQPHSDGQQRRLQLQQDGILRLNLQLLNLQHMGGGITTVHTMHCSMDQTAAGIQCGIGKSTNETRMLFRNLMVRQAYSKHGAIECFNMLSNPTRPGQSSSPL